MEHLDEKELAGQIELLCVYFGVRRYVHQDREYVGYTYFVEAVKQRYCGMEERGIIKHLATVFGVSSSKISSAIDLIVCKGQRTHWWRYDRLLFRQCRTLPETISAFAQWLHTYRGAKLRDDENGKPVVIWRPYEGYEDRPRRRMVRFLSLALREIDPYLDSIEIDRWNDELINVRFVTGDRDIVRCEKPLYDVMVDVVMLCREHSLDEGVEA
ncbi:hypothetical protein [Pseudoflavonifractor phocaeensis]|uniref:hypothetical protein n=1 Tax=Pseudoflavonifractor phocaeensis TaxID=1870988 RepID=UPI00210B5942|nr:hypothetical protein [Pseudoflavonifractor phocaeensis]MCQ4862728.1 hypothetical protein [Pseudoflavonifractor phocaeensis]